MTTARELAQILAGGGNDGLSAGRLAYEARKAQRGGWRTAPALKRIADDALAASKTVPPTAPRHPENAAAPRSSRDKGPLKPSDLAWLARIADTDPAKLPYDDAVALAEIRHRVPTDEVSDSRYIDSIWHPVSDYHTRRVATAKLATVKGTAAQIPADALAVVVAALTAELSDQFSTGEITTRAQALLDEAAANHGARQYAEAHSAQETLDRLKADQAARAQVDR